MSIPIYEYLSALFTSLVYPVGSTVGALFHITEFSLKSCVFLYIVIAESLKAQSFNLISSTYKYKVALDIIVPYGIVGFKLNFINVLNIL